MGRKDKLLARLQQRPKDFTWNELTTLLNSLGYKQAKPGKTGGSMKTICSSESRNHHFA